MFASFSSVRGGRGRGVSSAAGGAGARRMDPSGAPIAATTPAAPKIERAGPGLRGVGAAFTTYQLVCQLVLGSLLSAEDRVDAATQLWHEWVWEDNSPAMLAKKKRRSSVASSPPPIIHEARSLMRVMHT